MTQPMPTRHTLPTSPSPSACAAPLAPPALWSRLDLRTQQQLAQCLCDLIRRVRGVPTVTQKERSHDRDSYEP
jgi:hypothetical protein